MQQNQKYAAAAAICLGTFAVSQLLLTKSKPSRDYDNVLIGDVGGTNVRL